MGAPFDLSVAEGIGCITFNRPKSLNSLTFEVYRELVRFFEDARRDTGLKVVVLTGTGKGFCSGGDVFDIIGELVKMPMDGVLEFARMTGDLVKAIRLLDRPVIAAVNGLAAGAGAVIALACDLRVCAASSSFRFLFTQVGLTGADMGAGYLLPKVVGLSKATELLLLGDAVDADTAARIGLANRVVPDAELMPAATEWARRLAEGPTLAISMTKRMLQNELNMDIVTAVEAEAQAQALMLQGRDHKAFYEAFKEKRKPRFEGA
ncbi:MAG TPA: enoyl-CoA hydratase family protein [Planctomycetota bacterium]|nr:enoyl-CoA hydratase family protein [Planctomycetota bacterium]